MDEVILFSGVGDTDPYRDGYDGALTHIVRYYKPKKVYLYFSKEKMDEENVNNRYSRAIKYLDEDIEIEAYPKREEDLITDVHKYDIFYSQFLTIIKDIKMKYPHCTLLLNMSSGTPAMKSSMILLKILLTDINIKLIQVASPKRKSNASTSHEKMSEYEDVEAKMEQVMENHEKELGLDLNRCTEEELDETIKIVTIENIKKMFLKRDFCGIYNLIEERKELFNDDIVNYSKHLYYRYIGDVKKALEIARKLRKEEDLYPIKDEYTKAIIEKYDRLEVKLERHEYSDYLMGLGPAIEEIVKVMIERRGIELSKFVYFAKNSSEEELKKDNNINILKLKQAYPSLYETLNIGNEKGWEKLKWSNIVKILRTIYTEQDKNDKIPEMIKSIDKFRSDRNIVAHTLRDVEYNPKEFEKVQQNLKFLIIRIKTGKDKNFEKAIDIYNHIEKELIDLLDKSLIK
ncbi:MAG: hypothetical protein HFJ30_06145 [Clostridia bacterium]|nr:hypothetical protein [Clostridia bacterium]